ncbi:MAG: hypothetical protein DI539_30525 [Flavobacterium psychrophilum]|nr:MAG: hypothetical protein DI539_30525 [Flavobacterium psychrophilum]
MKKLLTIALILPVFAFSQKKKTSFVNLPKETLYKKFKNSIYNETIELNEKELQKNFQLYYCIIKKYKEDLSDDSIFESRKEYLKKKKDTTIEGIWRNNYHHYLFVDAPYEKRWDYADSISKCINPKDWKF